MVKAALAAGLSCALLGCGSSGVGVLQAQSAGDGAATPARNQLAAADPVAAQAGAPTAAGAPETASGAWLHAATPSAHVMDRGDTDIAVWIDVPKGGAAVRLPTAVTLSVDTSGSMAGPKMDHAKRAASSLVAGLHAGDMVSLHAFDDVATVRLAPTVLDALSRDRIQGVISGLSARGATNIADALHLGQSAVAQSLATHPVRRLVVISDGQATVGTSDPSSLGRIAALGAHRGVQITALGVGMDYDERTLNELAVKTSGRMFHIGNPRDLPAILERELALLQDTRATDAVVELIPAQGARIVSVRGAEIPAGRGAEAGTVRVPLGALFGGQTRELVVRMRLGGVEHSERALLSARLLFRDPKDDGLSRMQEAVVRSTVTRDEALLTSSVNARASAIVSTFAAADLTQIASAHAARGDFDAADRELAKAEGELRRRAEHAKDASERQLIASRAAKLGSARASVQAAAQAPPSAKPAQRRQNQLDLNEAAMKMQGF
ncbi:MAG: VWA domain-containing protein [Polyangiaceae bacterium]|nr:VWA domain-containing protein [Polyangiaceae bacterium]